jgi:hypothetical protein
MNEPRNPPRGAHKSDVAARALDALRAYDYPLTANVDVLAEMLVDALKRPWQAGDPCGVCDSTNTTEDAIHGGVCLNCGRQDDDA